jgi:hypothetical protein
MTREDSPLRVYEHRDIEPERLDAPSDLTDLVSAMPPRVVGIERQRGDRTRHHAELRSLTILCSTRCVCTLFFLHLGTSFA